MAAVYVNAILPFFTMFSAIVISSLAYYKVEYCAGVCTCDDVFLRINCSDTVMEALPPGLPREYHSLSLKNSNFQTLTPENFNVSSLANLRELSVVNSNVELVQNGTLSVLTKLVSLDLRDNYLYELPYGISLLTKLQILDMTNNLVSTISSHTFTRHYHLRNLFLEDNLVNLSQIERGSFSSLIRLRKLTITKRMSIYNYYDQYYDSSLQNSYDSFPPSNISDFSMVDDPVECINVASWFDKPRQNLSLVQLVLSNNAINCINGSSFNGWFSKLQILELSSNQLESLPFDVFASLIALENLYLNDNNLRYIPEHIFHNNFNLKILHLQHNALLYLSPDTLVPLSNSLAELDLSRNALQSWNATSLGNFAVLQILDIRGNEITDQEHPLNFTNIPLLMFLRLSYNRLQHFPKVKGLRYLVKIALTSNYIRKFPKNAFQGCERLERVRIPRNQLRIIPKLVIAQAERLERLEIYSNPIQCDCHLKWMKDALVPTSRYVFLQDTIFESLCASPKLFHNKSLFEVLENSETDLICNEYPDQHHITWLITVWLSLLVFAVACKLYNIFPGSRRNFHVCRRRKRVLEDDEMLVEFIKSNRKHGQKYELVRDDDSEPVKVQPQQAATDTLEPKLLLTPSKMEKVNWYTLPETPV